MAQGTVKRLDSGRILASSYAVGVKPAVQNLFFHQREV